jgi:preprotein translocase subunit YajC
MDRPSQRELELFKVVLFFSFFYFLAQQPPQRKI